MGCYLCISNCSVCVRSDACLTCNSGYGLDKLNRCDKCAENCLSCQYNGSGACDLCITGYGLTSNNTCQVCADNCHSCSLSGAGSCDICNEGYGLTASNTCGLCYNNTTGDLTNCLSCWNSGAGMCDSCGANMYSSYPSFTCETCPPAPTATYFTNYCQQCKSYSVNNDTCVQCAADCADCSVAGAGKCDTCDSGFYLNNDTCTACNANCLECTSTACTTCADPWVPTGADCNPSCSAVADCDDCSTNGTSCDTCLPKFMVDGSGQCAACTDPLCESCDSSVDVCDYCVSGYSMFAITSNAGVTTNTCLKCAQNCDTCVTSGFSNCDVCTDGFILVKNKNSALCLDSFNANSCKNEVTISGQNFCYECADDYARTLNGLTCAYNKYKNCKVYFNDTVNCFECVEGYDLIFDTSSTPVFPMGQKCTPSCDLKMAANQNILCSQQLLKFLFYIQDYDPFTVAQETGNNQINVYLSFNLINITDINIVSGNMQFIGSPVIYWRDDRLDWEVSKWNQTRMLMVPNASIWTPDLAFVNSCSGVSLMNNTKMLKLFGGSSAPYWYNIEWSPQGEYKLSQKYDLFYFPSDIQTLQFRIESQSFSADQMVLHLRSEQMPEMDDIVIHTYAKSNITWKYLRDTVKLTEVQYGDTKFYSVSFYVSMQRTVHTQSTFIFYPILMMLSLAIANLYIEDMASKSANGLIIILSVSWYLTVAMTSIPSVKENILLNWVYLVIFLCLFLYLAMVYCRWIMLEYRERKKKEELRFIEQFHNYEEPQESQATWGETTIDLVNNILMICAILFVIIMFIYIKNGDVQ